VNAEIGMDTLTGERVTSRIRVLHVVDSLGVGGTELGLAKVIEGTREKIAHSVCAVRAGGATADRLDAHGVPVRVLGKRPGNDWTVPLRFARLCRQTAPDVVHTRNWGSVDAIVGARLARVPVVIHGEHGREASDPDGINRRRNRLRRMVVVLADRVVAVSEQLRTWLIREVGVPERKVSLLKNGVDAERFCPRDDRCDLRRAHGYGPQDIVVGTVGRLDPVKNQTALLEVLATLTATQPRLRVVIAGTGPERESLTRAVGERGLADKVALLGQRNDVPDVLNLLDVFILPSLGEGMCNTILEAMAVGLPVVATRVGGNPELVDDGVTGRLVPVCDDSALARAIALYAGDEGLRRKHGAAGRRRVVEEFSVGAMAERYLQLYRSEVERKRSAV
jgi:sugar transferase (PEP-CTERM/EpsH1 system associated)